MALLECNICRGEPNACPRDIGVTRKGRSSVNLKTGEIAVEGKSIGVCPNMVLHQPSGLTLHDFTLVEQQVNGKTYEEALNILAPQISRQKITQVLNYIYNK